MSIQILSDQLVSQIAAGEVVERPASVVKELLENALDAGAANVHVTVNGGGRKLIRVSDDGSGIPADEVRLAFTRHATSKLRTAEDLTAIRTLGFRGEALASIASVSRVSMTTRHRSEATGTTIRIEGGALVSHQPAGAPAGTIISVENLFYNTPARLKFLKKETTEKRHVVTLMMRYAMAYPQVRFVLEQDGREAFRSNGSGQLIDVLAHVLGLADVKEMLPVELATAASESQPAVSVSGFTSLPGLTRSDRSHIALFVNGRWIQDANLTYAVVQAYQGLLKPGRYPISVLMIGMSPEDVDVNVHPTKAEVRFRNANAVFAAVQRGVRRVLADAQSPHLRESALERSAGESYWEPSHRDGLFNLGANSPTGTESASRRVPRHDPAYDPTAIPEGPEGPAKPRTLPVLRVVGQVGAMYVVTEGPAGMYLIDQYGAHQRVLYEEFMEAYALGDGITRQGLAAPQTVDLSVSEAESMEQHFDLLASLGFEVEPFGPTTVALRAVPVMLQKADPEAVLRGMAGIIGSRAERGALEDRLITYICGCAAYKAGQVLSLDDMQSLVRRLERCQSPQTSPEGATTIIHMSGDQLAREFRRRV